MIFGRKLRSSDPRQITEHIAYIQGVLEEKAEQLERRLRESDEKLSAAEAQIQELSDIIAAETAETEA